MRIPRNGFGVSQRAGERSRFDGDARRRDRGGSGDRVDHDIPGAGDHLAVKRAAPGHPGVAEANERQTGGLGAGDRRLRRAKGGDHAVVVATVQKRRRPGFPHHRDRAPRMPEMRIVHDVEQFRQA